MGAAPLITQSQLAMQLRPVSMREVALLCHAPCSLYFFNGHSFEALFERAEIIDKEKLKELISNGNHHLFVAYNDYGSIENIIQNSLTSSSRSLSRGNPVKVVPKQLNMLSLNMASIYTDPMSDEKIQTQYQSLQNLANLLIETKSDSAKIYAQFERQSHYYIIAQPMLSSFLYLEFLKYTKAFNQDHLKKLFITSYFKDLGMATIPKDKFEKSILSPSEKKLFSNHAKQSVDLLRHRLPLEDNYFELMVNHHGINNLFNKQENLTKYQENLQVENLAKSSGNQIFGIETIMMGIFDILTAMTNKRPYRQSYELFDALKRIKAQLPDEYKSEFKGLVLFLKKFFK